MEEWNYNIYFQESNTLVTFNIYFYESNYLFCDKSTWKFQFIYNRNGRENSFFERKNMVDILDSSYGQQNGN